MKLTSITAALLLLLPILLSAQEEKPIIIIGIEGGAWSSFAFDKVGTQSARSVEYGFSVEKPLIDKFSFGIGLTRSTFGEFRSYSLLDPMLITEQGQTVNYAINEYEIERTAIPLKLIYRLKCNCLFFQTSYIPEFQKLNQTYSRTGYSKNVPNQPGFSGFRSRNASVEVGVGAKIHFTHSFRMLIRMDYRSYLNPIFSSSTRTIADKFFKFSLGFQQALFLKN